MARSGGVIWDWNVFFGRVGRREGGPALWSRFPLELAPDLIVCPHLFDWPEAAPRGHRVYTAAGAPRVALFCSRGAAHRRFLVEEVVPRVHEHVRFVCVVDGDAEDLAFAPLGAARRLGLEHLAPLLRVAYGVEVLPPEIPEQLRAQYRREAGERFLFADRDPTPEAVARAEAHPLRLWEALFWRGHSYRYELVDGAVPLVGDFPSALAANRTLMQLVRDAERLEGVRAGEGEGFLCCGRFRLRQMGTQIEIRVRLSPADVRAAFMPQHLAPGASDLPSLVGALMAGGDNGKTELWNGWTWSTIEASSEAELARVTGSLVAEIRALTDSPVSVIPAGRLSSLPEESREEWFVAPHGRWLTVYVPFARNECLPWAVASGDFASPGLRR